MNLNEKIFTLLLGLFWSPLTSQDRYVTVFTSYMVTLPASADWLSYMDLSEVFPLKTATFCVWKQR